MLCVKGSPSRIANGTEVNGRPYNVYFHRKLSFLFKIGWYNNHYIFIHLYFFQYFSYTNGFRNASRSTHKLCKFRLIPADLTWAKLQSGKCPPVSKRTTSHKPNAEFFFCTPIQFMTCMGNTKIVFGPVALKFEVVLTCGTEVFGHQAELPSVRVRSQFAACRVQPLRSPSKQINYNMLHLKMRNKGPA